MERLISLLDVLITDRETLRVAVIFVVSVTFIVFGLGIGYLFLGAADPVRRRLRLPKQVTTVSEKGRTLVFINTMMGPSVPWKSSV